MMENPRPTKQHSPDAASVLAPALKFGAVTGFTGFVVGGVAGVLRNGQPLPPLINATSTSILWFGLGTTYLGGRNILLQDWDNGSGVTPSEKATASGIAGAVAGSVVRVLDRGVRHFIPGGIIFGLLGFGGQHLYNAFFDKSARSKSTSGDDADDNIWKRISLKKWSPFSILTDKQYEDLLNEKLLRLDADIAVIDDKIAALKVQEKTWLASQAEQSSQKPTGST